AIEATTSTQAVHSTYLQLGMRHKAMLTDKQVNTNLESIKSLDFSQLTPDQKVQLSRAIDSIKASIGSVGDRALNENVEALQPIVAPQPSTIDTQSSGGGEDNKA